MSKAERAWKDRLASMTCVVGQRHGGCEGRINLHHVAEGSGLRSPFGLVPLCEGHHTGPAGLHGLGSKRFITLYRPPGDSEYGLLVWLNEQLAEGVK